MLWCPSKSVVTRTPHNTPAVVYASVGKQREIQADRWAINNNHILLRTGKQ